MKKLRNFTVFIILAALALAVHGNLPSAFTQGAVDRYSTNVSATKAPYVRSTPSATPAPSPSPTPTPKPTPTPIPTPSPTPRPTAKVGDRGDAVMQIQQRLADLGYLKGAVDGVYGKQTAAAIRAFQTAIGLDATGEADEVTSRELFFRFTKAAATPVVTRTPKPTKKAELSFPEYRDSASKGTKYVLNKNTKKFHRPNCTHVKKIKPKNYKEYTGTRDEVINMGYVPCKVCDP